MVDGIQTGIVVPSSCDAKGCTATFVPSTTMLARILRGNELEAEFRTVSSVKGTSIALDLPRLAEGLMAMANSVSPAGSLLSKAVNDRTSDFKVNLVSRNDLPKDKLIQISGLKQALSIASALITCDRGGIGGTPIAEHRPHPVDISVNARMELINFTAESATGLNELADITHRCGNEYFIAVIADPHDISRAYSWPLFQIQEAAVANVLTDHGISKNRLLVPDYRAGLLVSQTSDQFIGEWVTLDAAGKEIQTDLDK